jgi:two-component system NtrC family sensor kinase
LQRSFIDMLNKLREAQHALAAQVTEERRMREELQSLQRHVIRQERLAAIGVLVSGVAHELNNPLQAILGFADLLQMRKDLPSDVGSELALIQKESTRAHAIIRNLSRFSRQQTADPSPVRLRDVVASVVELRQRRLEENGITLDVTELADPHVLAVFAELQQVVLNLMINAEQAVMDTPEPRRITVVVSREAERARLEMQDTGPGVPGENEPKLFQPFFTTKPVGQGTGLGLSVSYGIIQSHGGTIGYQRAPNGGALFYFELPLVSPARAA